MTALAHPHTEPGVDDRDPRDPELRLENLFDADSVALDPRHPYTQALFATALPIDVEAPRDEAALAGEVPSPLGPPAGCRFHPRCPHAMPRCAAEEPVLRPAAGRFVACHLY